jgi:hypothetical protein
MQDGFQSGPEDAVVDAIFRVAPEPNTGSIGPWIGPHSTWVSLRRKIHKVFPKDHMLAISGFSHCGRSDRRVRAFATHFWKKSRSIRWKTPPSCSSTSNVKMSSARVDLPFGRALSNTCLAAISISSPVPASNWWTCPWVGGFDRSTGSTGGIDMQPVIIAHRMIDAARLVLWLLVPRNISRPRLFLCPDCTTNLSEYRHFKCPIRS